MSYFVIIWILKWMQDSFRTLKVHHWLALVTTNSLGDYRKFLV